MGLSAQNKLKALLNGYLCVFSQDSFHQIGHGGHTQFVYDVSTADFDSYFYSLMNEFYFNNNQVLFVEVKEIKFGDAKI